MASGLAKAVIHNSDYASVAEAKAAIDRYFRERNEHFRRNPRRAGKKIEDAPIVVEKERFSLGAYRVGKLLVFKAKKENRNGKSVW